MAVRSMKRLPIRKTIVDIQNQDLEIDLSSASQTLTLELDNCWAIELIDTTKL